MKKLTMMAACALALSACAQMPEQNQAADQSWEKRYTEEDDLVTGSRIARKAPKNTAPAGATAGSAKSANP